MNERYLKYKYLFIFVQIWLYYGSIKYIGQRGWREYTTKLYFFMIANIVVITENSFSSKEWE